MNDTAIHYRLLEWALLDDTAFIRRARKQHWCDDVNSSKREPCRRVIEKGEYYVEYVGETPLYQSGQRYHLECGARQGIVELVPQTATDGPQANAGRNAALESQQAGRDKG